MAKPDLEVHPAAKVLPMLTDEKLSELARDLELRGQLFPIIVHEGKILDGRNRLAACKLVGRDPWIEPWDGRGGSPTAFAASANLPRRHLSKDQLAMAARDFIPLFEAEAAARMKAGKKVESQTLPPRGRKGSNGVNADPTTKGTAAAKAAAAAGVGARSVERAKMVDTKRPDLAQLVREGRQTLKQAEKAIRREEQTKHVLEYRPPVGTYAVIVADVPWQYDDQLDGSDQVRGGTGYPTMSLDEICKIKPPAAPDCALWFWVTNAFLIDGSAARVLEAWGFEPKSLLTWVKDRWGAGHYLRNQTEHCVLAVRGKPVIRGSDQPTFFNAPRTNRHSQKPDAFYELAERVTPCPPKARIELFAIDERKGWVTSGSEQQAKTKKRRRENMRVRDVAETSA